MLRDRLSISHFFCHPLPPLSLWLSLSLTLDWWNCQWFITNVSGRRSRLLFCPCQSQVEPEVGSFAYQSKPLRSPPPPLSVQSLLDHYLSKPRANTVVMEIVAYGGREAETNRKWHKTFQVSICWEHPTVSYNSYYVRRVFRLRLSSCSCFEPNHPTFKHHASSSETTSTES